MAAILVCPLSQLEARIRWSGTKDVVTLMSRGGPELPAIQVARHLWLDLSDITEHTPGHTLAGERHLSQLLEFSQGWNRQGPLLIHCYAGVSRSTAAAFVLACALRPALQESVLAATIRALSPTATPNARIVALADAMLDRSGRMTAAVAAMGRGADCFEGIPFALEV